jgi:O-antigen/teichoic acid export membrane protein
LSTQAFAEHLQEARAVLRQRQVGGAIARTAVFNAVTAAAGALSGVIVARAVGPTVRGEYAAVTAWFGLLLMLGEVGQSAAVCFHVARDPGRGRGYVATSRTLMLVTGTVALVSGLLLAPVLAHGAPGLAGAYRIAFGGLIVGFIGTSYIYGLQARNTARWNLVRVSQPVLALLVIIVLRAEDKLTLDNAVATVILTLTVQLGYSYYWCLRSELAPGGFRPELVGPLLRYGVSQLAANTPATVNNFLDMLVLSQLVPAADLGRYAIAVSVTLVPVPLVSAIGNVAFPLLAARRGTAAASTGRLQMMAVVVSAGLAAAILMPIAAGVYWLIPAVFGPAYRSAVPLVWILTPGGIFLACGQVVGDLLRGLNRPGLVAIGQGVAAVATLVLLFALLPSLGVTAAAVASTVAYGTALAVMVRWVRRPPLTRARHRPLAARPARPGRPSAPADPGRTPPDVATQP